MVFIWFYVVFIWFSIVFYIILHFFCDYDYYYYQAFLNAQACVWMCGKNDDMHNEKQTFPKPSFAFGFLQSGKEIDQGWARFWGTGSSSTWMSRMSRLFRMCKMTRMPMMSKWQTQVGLKSGQNPPCQTPYTSWDQHQLTTHQLTLCMDCVQVFSSIYIYIRHRALVA